MRIGRLIAAWLLALGVLASGAVAGNDPPRRVVSMNLCTDQLAMLLAGEGQLISVSRVALDPMVSPLAERAGDFTINHGQAEEIHLMRPDLVLAGTLSPRATVAMLRRLGVNVVEFAPAETLGEVRARIAQMGEVLHREAAAGRLLDGFDARLAALAGAAGAARPRAVIYHANGYVSGRDSLSGDILDAAGFENAAERAGYGSGRRMPLEVLALTEPDIVITTSTYPGASRSEAVLEHPVVESFRRGRAQAVVADQSWVCGTPFVLDTVEALAGLRRALAGAGE